MPYVTLVAAVISPFAAASLDAIAPLFLLVGSMLAMAHQANRRASRFEAALPIPARSLYTARVLALLSVFLFPALAAAGSILVFARTAAPGTVLAPLEMTPFFVLLAAIMLSVQARQAQGPKWLFFVTYLPLYGAAMWAVKSQFAGPAALACAAVAAALLLRTWAAVPKAFQIAASGDLRPARAVKKSASGGGVAWGPVLRSVFSGVFIMFLCYLPGGSISGEWLLGGVFVPFLWLMVRQKTRWLWALPVNPRLLLATMVAPMLLMLIAGYFAGFHIGRHPRAIPDARTLIVNVACTIGWTLLFVLLSASPDWRRLRRIAFILRPVWTVLVFFILPLGCVALTVFQRSLFQAAPSREIALWLSGALPASLPLAVALLASLLAAIYWAANRVFEEAEFSDKLITKKDMDSIWGK